MIRSMIPVLGTLLLAGSVTAAQAATSNDDGAGNVHTGNGTGDLVLALRVGDQSITWDLSATGLGTFNDLTVNDLLALSAAGTGFSISNTGLDSFLLGKNLATASWSVFGISNKGTSIEDANGPFPTQVGLVSTVDGSLSPMPTGENLGASLLNYAQWIQNNVDATSGLPDNGTTTADSSQTHFFGVFQPGTEIGGQDAAADAFNEVLDLYFLRKDPSRPLFPVNDSDPGSDALPALAEHLGSVKLSFDGARAELTFISAVQPVPLPAAGWLLGAALAGLGGIARRRG